MDRVKRYYDQCPEREWNRLDVDSYHRIEFAVTLHFIHKYLRPSDRILDVGGGPGRYALHFLERGHRVALVDLSTGALERARAEIERRRLTDRLEGIHERSATDLEGIQSDAFDITLLLGPLYHLIRPDDRERAVREARRVTRPGGYVFAAILPRLNPLRDWLRQPADRARAFLCRKDDTRDLLERGVYENAAEDPTAFTDAHFAAIHEVPALYEAAGVESVEAFSCEGVAAFFNDKVNELVDGEETWNRLLRLILETCAEPSNLGAGEHCVFVGRKQP